MKMQNETPITLSQVENYLPSGKRRCLATIWRWCMGKGVKGVRLEYWREGVQIWTTVEAVKRFRERVKRVSERCLQKVG